MSGSCVRAVTGHVYWSWLNQISTGRSSDVAVWLRHDLRDLEDQPTVDGAVIKVFISCYGGDSYSPRRIVINQVIMAIMLVFTNHRDQFAVA
jgi:hypothetical protein